MLFGVFAGIIDKLFGILWGVMRARPIHSCLWEAYWLICEALFCGGEWDISRAPTVLCYRAASSFHARMLFDFVVDNDMAPSRLFRGIMFVRAGRSQHNSLQKPYIKSQELWPAFSGPRTNKKLPYQSFYGLCWSQSSFVWPFMIWGIEVKMCTSIARGIKYINLHL